MEEYVLICEDTIEGILTGVYEAYQFKKDTGIESHNAIHLAVKEPDMMRLFTHYDNIKTDNNKAGKVMNTIKRQLGDDTYYQLCLAMLSDFEEKADAVYHTIVLGLKMHDRCVLDRLYDYYVNKAFSYSRAAGNELHHFKEFLRFAELNNGILYARIDAKHNILSFLMPHFADRLPADNFVIYDGVSKTFGLHPKYKQWYLVSGMEIDEDSLKYSSLEREYQELFKGFCSSIAIESRVNPKLQMNMLPLRFRPNMTEFKN